MGEASRGEAAAWKQLRALRGEGFAFRREHGIGDYRADFVCLRRRVIVEIDGGVHNLPGRAMHDAKRDAWLSAEGYVVLRFRDSVILSEANWLQTVRDALLAQSDAQYRCKTAIRADRNATLPLEGGGQGGGEVEERDISNVGAPQTSNAEAHLTLPQPPPLQGGG